MKSPATAFLALVALCTLGAKGQFGEIKASDRTITKVVKLLRNMLDKSKQDGDSEHHIFTKFKCYCDSSEAEKTAAIEASKKTIDLLEAGIQQTGGDIGQSNGKSGDYMRQLDDNLNAIRDADFLRKEHYSASMVKDRELRETVRLIDQAITELATTGADQTLATNGDNKKFMAGFKGSSLADVSLISTVGVALHKASVHSKVRSTLRLAAATMTTLQRRTVEAFLQAPFTGTYTSQSGQVLGMLKNMNKEFRKQIASNTKEIEQKDDEFREFRRTLDEENAMLRKAIGKLGKGMSVDKLDLETKKVELAEEKKELDNVEEFMGSLVPMCKEKSESYATRKELRANEEAAIAKAISILASDDAFTAFSNTLSTTSTKRGDTSTTSGTAGTAMTAGAFLQIKQSSHAPLNGYQDLKRFLQQASRMAESKRLPAIISALQADNPFDDVLEEIDNMLERIKVEGKSDVSRKATCRANLRMTTDDLSETKSNLGTTKANLQDTTQDITKPNEGVLAVIQRTEQSLMQYTQFQTDITSSRTEENLAYQTNVANLDQAEIILTKAIKVLKTYYDDLEQKIDRDSAGLLQKSHKATDHHLTKSEWWQLWEGAPRKSLNLYTTTNKEKDLPDPDATWEGSYAGQKGDGNDAVTLLKFILDETQKEHTQAHAEEEKSQHGYEDEMTVLKDKEAKAERRLSKFQEQLSEKQKDELDYTEDVKRLTAEKEGYDNLLEKTQAGCKFILDNFNLRVKNRIIEANALKKAIRLIRATPEFQSSEHDAVVESYGDCKEICTKDDRHVKCLACQAQVTIVAYCVGHETAKGCNTRTKLYFTGPASPLPLMTNYDELCFDYNYDTQNVAMTKCHEGKNQQWYLDSRGRLLTAYNNKCLHYNPRNKNVAMRACDDRAPNQKWYFDEQAKRLKTKFDDKCLDYNYNNQNVYMHGCHDGKNQKWYFNSVVSLR